MPERTDWYAELKAERELAAYLDEGWCPDMHCANYMKEHKLGSPGCSHQEGE